MIETLGAKLTPNDYFKRATDLYYNERYQDALDALERGLELKPDDASAWSKKGLVLSDLGRHKDSLNACERAIALEPDNVEAWRNKGNALLNLERHEDQRHDDPGQPDGLDPRSSGLRVTHPTTPGSVPLTIGGILATLRLSCPASW